SIPNVRVQDAGSYSVVVMNSFDILESEKALLLLAYPLTSAPDSFAQRHTLVGHSNTVVGTNFFSSKETGEPFHAGKRGGRSIWYRWIPDMTGIATFDTRGSTYDTLLAVYTVQSGNFLQASSAPLESPSAASNISNAFGNLKLIARDED